MDNLCESCINFEYDEEFECYSCIIDMDEDEIARFSYSPKKVCPYFRPGDEYTIVRKQN